MYLLQFMCVILLTVTPICVCFEYSRNIDHGDIGIQPNHPFNIAHRGSSGMYPEHTVIAYEKAKQEGANMIECDVTVTKDLRLVCRHKAWIGDTTNVKDVAKYADRRSTHFVEGINRTDWYTFDFTLDELLELRAIQPLPFRDQTLNTKFAIATFDQYISVAKSTNPPTRIYPEIKNPHFINSIPGLLPTGMLFEDLLIQELEKHGYSKKTDGCMIQSFEEDSLIYIKQVLKTEIPLVICLEYDVTDSVLDRWVSSGFYGVGAWKDLVYRTWNQENQYKNYIYESTDFVDRLHQRRLKLHLFSFRNEDRYIGWDYGQDIFNEYRKFFALDIEGYITDFPGTLTSFMNMVYSEPRSDDTCVNSP